jgi:predicted  nucleic acid-binding Zn-ribbon protein
MDKIVRSFKVDEEPFVKALLEIVEEVGRAVGREQALEDLYQYEKKRADKATASFKKIVELEMKFADENKRLKQELAEIRGFINGLLKFAEKKGNYGSIEMGIGLL